ncbi:MAG: hypothetical protein IKZ87_04950 [Actinomycetaceae bacterium]|nr:hypothetical protein [Actinomycetaceae bacterium]
MITTTVHYEGTNFSSLMAFVDAAPDEQRTVRAMASDMALGRDFIGLSLEEQLENKDYLNTWGARIGDVDLNQVVALAECIRVSVGASTH